MLFFSCICRFFFFFSYIMYVTCFPIHIWSKRYNISFLNTNVRKKMHPFPKSSLLFDSIEFFHIYKKNWHQRINILIIKEEASLSAHIHPATNTYTYRLALYYSKIVPFSYIIYAPTTQHTLLACGLTSYASKGDSLAEFVGEYERFIKCCASC